MILFLVTILVSQHQYSISKSPSPDISNISGRSPSQKSASTSSYEDPYDSLLLLELELEVSLDFALDTTNSSIGIVFLYYLEAVLFAIDYLTFFVDVCSFGRIYYILLYLAQPTVTNGLVFVNCVFLPYYSLYDGYAS